MTELDRMIKRAARMESKGYPGAIKLCDVYEFMAHLQRWEWKALMPRSPFRTSLHEALRIRDNNQLEPGTAENTNKSDCILSLLFLEKWNRNRCVSRAYRRQSNRFTHEDTAGLIPASRHHGGEEAVASGLPTN